MKGYHLLLRSVQDLSALLWVLAATLATWAAWPNLEPTVTPLFLAAIAISGWLGGLRSGLIAAILSTVAALLLSLNLGWHGDLGFASATWTASFLLVALLTGALTSARHRAEQLLIERDHRMKLVSDQIPAGLWSTDTELRLTSMFGAGLPALSDDAAELRVKDVFNESGVAAAISAEQAHRQALAGKPASFETTLHGRICQSHVEALHDPNGQIIGVVGVALDISDRKRAEQELTVARDQATRARQEAEAANRAKDRFLAMLSHELRTPLAPALIAAAALEESDDLPVSVRQDLSMIRRNIELEAILIDDLLDLTRVSRGKLELNLRPTDAHEVLSRAIDICRPDSRQKHIDLVIDLSAEHSQVMADAPRLEQVFWNLIKNAVKFTSAGGKVTIRTRNEDSGSQLVVEVNDTGIGIEPDLLPRVFNAFEQGAASITREFGGLGLGLAISKSLMKAHGGTIGASSAGAGRGATFYIRLAAVPQPAPVGIPAKPVRRHAVRKPLKILLVEDHADTRQLMGRLLGRLGYDIRTAESVASALEEFDARPVELLVSDIALPDGTGLDLMRHLRARTERVRGIALTGYGMEDEIRRCREAGFVMHLTKPVKLDVLEEVIQQVAG